ncbi:Exocyst complex, component Exoc1 [Akanthomyces lecanii RCEF 1005]|uniref:Exocyst complex, component Exoc1 n=1 Tax=Akanthomyces lecanii RCEF 1005 TaxID=1081108 RepID=A0A168C3V3_CORDF|nr:Exocyst complex, component Exoc1 [Akanthomyces lecanii RCEF 1005]
MDRANGAGSGAAASRAERFEDEKRRIIESCFSKKDQDGSMIETYITHIKITEYSTHPTSPPPPQARTPDSEKPRVIIVAVRQSGRVRMHKSKENANGTFSIGKTWNLDDLSHIESYTGPQVSLNLRDWAGDTGFTVTLGKQYYWQAQTDKEKKFFVASLIKIYSKYTGGKVPELNGFDPREQDQVLGAGRRQANAPPRPNGTPISQVTPGLDSAPSSVTSTPSGAPRQATPDSSRLQKPPFRPPLNGANSPASSFESSFSKERSDRPPPPRWAAQNNKSHESFATSMSASARSDDTASQPPRSRNGPSVPAIPGRFGDSRDMPEQPPTVPQGSELPPPERRRPPMDPSRPMDRDVVPPPLNSPINKKDPVFPPPRSSDRNSPMTGPPGRAVEGESSPETPKPRGMTPPVMTRVKSESGSVSQSDESVRSPPAVPAEPTEESRPGLGPMIKSKRSRGDIAGVFWKAANAATAASAFKPRPGGAAERLRLAQAQQKPTDGPDGITGVVPAPPRPVSRDKRPETPEAVPAALAAAPAATAAATAAVIQSNLPAPSPPPTAPVPPPPEPTVPEVTVTPTPPPVLEPQPPKKAGPSEAAIKKAEEEAKEKAARAAAASNDSRYLQALGVDATLLDGRSQEFGKWLDYFGWVPGDKMRSHNVEELGVDIDRELNKAQAGGWLARFREEDERVGAIKQGVDLAIAECEELDNLLTLYSVELSTLSDDIAYIEAQGQGLQVQTANQKLLKKELESLLETCAITSNDLEALHLAPLDNLRGLEDAEASLVVLFKAMVKIDPRLKEGTAGTRVDQESSLNSNYGQMRIVQEKKQMYMQESGLFMRRFVEFMARQFDEAYAETKRALDGALSKKADSSHHNSGRELLWKYSPLMLYARDVDLENWNRLLQIYQDKSQPLYKTEFQNVITHWRKNARKMTGDEAAMLFTSQVEKQQEGVATAARKLTVKRSQTLARALRSPLADGSSRAAEKTAGDSRFMPFEIFGAVLDDLLPLVEMEQNFIIDFFHASTLESLDFTDTVAAIPPHNRRGGDLKRHRLMEPDRELARRVTRSMEIIFTFLETEIQRLMEWVLGQFPLQGVGVLAVLEKKISEISQSNQDYLNTTLRKVLGLLEGRFNKFVEEQLHAIEETKVKINKRKGVISFIRVFPTFLTAVENMIDGSDPKLPLRRMIDGQYERILKQMFDSLKAIAREDPTGGLAAGTNDPEGKEALNFHILLIENMNHFLEETDARGLEVLETGKDEANREYHEHIDLYLNAVMRRPLGKLLDYLENIEAQIQTGKSPTAIARQPSNSQAVFVKVLSLYDAKDLRKGIDALRKRVEKHFGDADEPALSRGLVAKVLTECENYYVKVENRIGSVTTNVYGGDVPFEWPRAEVKAAFRDK